jgi:carboxymethylenebutenolidase
LDLLVPEVEVDIVTEEVVYFEDVEWFLAYPQDDPNAPGIVMIHERRWLNEHIEDMARVLAMNGYRVLAVDLYEWQVATEFEQARTLSSQLDDDRALQHLLAAETYLRSMTDRVASLWRCLWWAQSLNLSIASDTLDATIVYYGRLPEDTDRIASINQPLLGIFAADDTSIPVSAVDSFVQELDALGMTSYDITIYPGVWHAFANPTGNNFSQAETISAWEQTLAFLDRVL